MKYFVFGRRFLLPFWSNSREDFNTVGKLQDPAAARLTFVPVAALCAEGCCRKLIGLLHQWLDSGFTYFFRRRHPQLCNRQTILVSLESTGPYQRKRCNSHLYALCGSRDTIVLDSCASEIQFPVTRPVRRRKNNCISRTTQRHTTSFQLRIATRMGTTLSLIFRRLATKFSNPRPKKNPPGRRLCIP